MNTNLLKAFITVVQEGSFSRAAERLFLSQPALSQNIKQLESHFAARLLKRLSGGHTMTAAGEILYKHALKICAAGELLEEEMRAFTAAAHEKLLIGATNVVGGYAVPCSIFIFKKKYPDATVSLNVGNRRQIMEQLAKDVIDIAVVEGEKPSEPYIAAEIHREEMVIAAPPQPPWAGKSSLSLKELSKAPLILREEGSATRDTVERTLRAAGLDRRDLNIVMELHDLQGIKAAVAAGHGIAILPRMAVKTELFNKLLLRLAIDTLTIFQPVYIAYKKKKRPPAAVEFINLMKSAAKGFC